MGEMLNKEVKEATKKKFNEEMENKVKLIFFTQEPKRLIASERLKGQECLFCKEARQLLTEVSSLFKKIDLEIFDFKGDKEIASVYGVDKIPATVILGDKDYGLRFFGIPSGYEYASLVEAIIDVSKGRTSLSKNTKEALKAIQEDIHIQVFVTPTCPYCPMAVRLGHQFAFECERIKADMVESTEFPHLAQKYNVFGVPKTIINKIFSIDGVVPEEKLLENVLKATTGESEGSK